MVCVSEPTFLSCFIALKVIAVFACMMRPAWMTMCCACLPRSPTGNAPIASSTVQQARDEVAYSSCKQPEGQWVNVEGWRAREDALKAIDDARRGCAEWAMDERSADAVARRRRARRRFGGISALFGAGLLVCGALLSGRAGAFDAVGLACVAYGIGLAVAGVWLALGHNPLDRGRR